jgi:hypothetical protein
MQQRETRVVEFTPDQQVVEILKGLTPADRDRLINSAIRAWAGEDNSSSGLSAISDAITGTSSPQPARGSFVVSSAGASAAVSPAPAPTTTAPVPTADAPPDVRVNFELTRIFGEGGGSMSAANASDDSSVKICNSENQVTVMCGTADALDILKSLRQPITPKEVWEIIEAIRSD